MWSWGLVGCFAFANLRLGAQLAFVPASRVALLASMALAVAAIARYRSVPLLVTPAEALTL